MKRFGWVLGVFLMCTPALAQTVSVGGTARDGNGNFTGTEVGVSHTISDWDVSGSALFTDSDEILNVKAGRSFGRVGSIKGFEGVPEMLKDWNASVTATYLQDERLSINERVAVAGMLDRNLVIPSDGNVWSVDGAVGVAGEWVSEESRRRVCRSGSRCRSDNCPPPPCPYRNVDDNDSTVRGVLIVTATRPLGDAVGLGLSVQADGAVDGLSDHRIKGVGEVTVDVNAKLQVVTGVSVDNDSDPAQGVSDRTDSLFSRFVYSW